MMGKGPRSSDTSTEFDTGRNITRLPKRVRFRSCGAVGYGPTLNKKGVDIRCDQVARFVKEQLVNYVGNNISAKGEGRREPFSCSLRRGGPIGKVLVHRWSPKVINNRNRLCGKGSTPRCSHEQRIYHCSNKLYHKQD